MRVHDKSRKRSKKCAAADGRPGGSDISVDPPREYVGHLTAEDVEPPPTPTPPQVVTRRSRARRGGRFCLVIIISGGGYAPRVRARTQRLDSPQARPLTRPPRWNSLHAAAVAFPSISIIIIIFTTIIIVFFIMDTCDDDGHPQVYNIVYYYRLESDMNNSTRKSSVVSQDLYVSRRDHRKKKIFRVRWRFYTVPIKLKIEQKRSTEKI